jgi:hypothetical protein
VPQIKSRGFVMYQNAQPHVGRGSLFVEGSPWGRQARLRHAANLCVQRAELKELLGWLMEEPEGHRAAGIPVGHPKFDIKYDPAAAKKLIAEARFSASKAPKVKVQTSASGSGQMMPIPMNEYISRL